MGWQKHMENEKAPNLRFKSSFCLIPDRLYRYKFKLYRYNFATATLWVSCTGTSLSCTGTTLPLLVFFFFFASCTGTSLSCTSTTVPKLIFFLFFFSFLFFSFFFFSLGSSGVDVEFGISFAFHSGFRCIFSFFSCSYSTTNCIRRLGHWNFFLRYPQSSIGFTIIPLIRVPKARIDLATLSLK